MKMEKISDMISKLVFIGTPQFSVPSLQALIDSPFKPVLVITQPDKPKGRKLVLTSPEIKLKADEYNIPVIQPDNINTPDVIKLLKDINPDIIVTISYGGYIGREIRKLPRFSCINIHPSILPLYRGATPIQNTLINGDRETAISIFKLVSKMDAGPLLFQNRYRIDDKICFTELEEFLAQKSAEDLLKFLNLINLLENDSDYLAMMNAQSTENIVDTFKVSHETRLLDWTKSAREIKDYVRAFAMSPGAYTYFRGKMLKILRCCITDEKSDKLPGTVIDIIKNQGFKVSCSDYNLLIEIVQAEGKKAMSSHDYNIGARIQIGEMFTNGI
jgi:methionyl-tRNA formyltransferase